MSNSVSPESLLVNLPLASCSQGFDFDFDVAADNLMFQDSIFKGLEDLNSIGKETDFGNFWALHDSDANHPITKEKPSFIRNLQDDFDEALSKTSSESDYTSRGKIRGKLLNFDAESKSSIGSSDLEEKFVDIRCISSFYESEASSSREIMADVESKSNSCVYDDVSGGYVGGAKIRPRPIGYQIHAESESSVEFFEHDDDDDDDDDNDEEECNSGGGQCFDKEAITYYYEKSHRKRKASAVSDLAANAGRKLAEEWSIAMKEFAWERILPCPKRRNVSVKRDFSIGCGIVSAGCQVV